MIYVYVLWIKNRNITIIKYLQISFKKHKQKVEDEKNIIFLNPSDTENGFFIETGWTSIGSKIKVPTKESEWKVKGNNILSDKSPVILQWNNNEGVTFEKRIELDDKYLFKISQQVKNNSNSPIDLYPYAQMTRNKRNIFFKWQWHGVEKPLNLES